MNVIKMNIDDLRLPEKNTRIHTKKQLEEFRRSVKMFGQIRPIVVDENNVILCGNGLYETLKSMGYTTADVYRVTELSSNSKKKLMMADNKIFGLGIDDIEVFDSFINELKDDLDIPGYDEDILRSMIADAEEVTGRISEYGTVESDVIRQIQENYARKEEKIQQSQNMGDAENSTPAKHADAPETQETPVETDRAFIICPECGCKIWL